MHPLLEMACRAFDRTKSAWESHASRRWLGMALVMVYLLSLLVIELFRRGLIPPSLGTSLPRSHFHAINVAFTFLLYVEVIDLVFGLSKSFSTSVGKQFEIFSLILLRQSFKEFAFLTEPLSWPTTLDPVLVIMSSALGGLFIFGILLLYYRSLLHQPITPDERETSGFIASKKCISLLLLTFFVSEGFWYAGSFLLGGNLDHFFDTFYTVLVFCDILIVLVSLRYSHSFAVVFRNSAFALATVLLRLALTAPPYFNALLGVGAALYVVAVTAIYNRIVPVQKKSGRCSEPDCKTSSPSP